MRLYFTLLAVSLFISCSHSYNKRDVKEVYNDGESFQVQIFIPSNWSKYDSFIDFKDEPNIYSSLIGSKDTSSFILIEIFNYQNFPISYTDIDSVLVNKMSIETSGDTTLNIISEKKYTNGNGKLISTCYYTSGIDDKYYYKTIVFVEDKKAAILTLTNKKDENELLQLADQVENTLNF